MFKKGDRVVALRDDDLVPLRYKKGDVLIVDQDNSRIPYCCTMDGKIVVEIYKYLVPEEIYNSPLYRIMNEKEDWCRLLQKNEVWLREEYVTTYKKLGRI